MLPLFEYGLPNTPLVRVSEAACGAPSTGSSFETISVPVSSLVLGVIPSLIGSGVTGLTVCYSGTSAVDTSFPLFFGSVDLVGPTIAQSSVCFFGSSCSVSLTGNKLSSAPSAVFLAYNACGTGGLPEGAFNFASERGISSFEGSSFYYETFGTVDSFLTDETTLMLCWVAFPGESQAMPVGNLTLTGPTASRIFSLVCFLGEFCRFTYPFPDKVNASESLFAISSTSRCDDQFLTPVVYPNSFGPFTAFENGSFSFGQSLAVNNQSVEQQKALCWKHNASDNPTFPSVRVGSFSMIGPQIVQPFSCIFGFACTIPVSGFFSANSTYNLSIAADCNGGNSILVNQSQQTSQQASEIITFIFSEISMLLVTSPAPLALCWNGSIYLGPLSLFGPTSLVEPDCVVSRPCSVVLPSFFSFEDNQALQRLSLMSALKNASDAPCASSSSAEVVSSSLAFFDDSSNSTFFDFPTPIPFASNDALALSLCWEIVGVVSSKAIFVGNWTSVGPESGIDATCVLGITQACQIAVQNPEPNSVLFLIPSDSSVGCDAWNKQMSLPVFLGQNVSNPTLAVTGYFGNISGFPNSTQTSYSICYSPRPANLRFSANLGLLTFV